MDKSDINEREEIAVDMKEYSSSDNSIGAGEGLWLAWKNITVSSQDGKKLLLGDVAGDVKGKFLAIMGPSGSGKTTLMNVLSRRIRNVKIEGELRIEGNNYNTSVLKRLSGYVMQDDLLFPHITVHETLSYAAELRLPKTMTKEERNERVDELIEQLSLHNCRNTIVGSALVKGISGGERKRLCVAIELLNSPKILFLDEPTSGLDSANAFSLCQTLKELAYFRGCTVLCTIHQPQSRIFQLFDSVLVLNAGKIIFHGSVPRLLEHYAEAGFPVPPLTNPADHILDVITPTKPEDRNIVKQNEEKLRKLYRPKEIELPSDGSDPKTLLPEEDVRIPWLDQFLVLFKRNLKNTGRQKRLIMIQLIQNILIALLIGFVFYQIGTYQYSTVRRQPVLFFCVINQGIFGALMLINSFPSEREIILRERAAGSYHVSSYFMAKVTVDSIVQIIYPFIFSIVVYWIVGLQPGADKFFTFASIIILCNLAATSMALMISTISRTTNVAVNILPMALEVARLFGGFFLSPANLPNYFVWLDALSYVKYSYIALSLNELTGLELSCQDSELRNGVCPITSGNQTIESLGLNEYTLGSCIGALLIYIIVCRVVAFFGLKFIKF